MWSLGKITCLVCGKQFSKAKMRLSPRDRRAAVCLYCYEAWWAQGRKCARCGYQVNATQVLSVFPELKSVGHFDCGGVSLGA